MTPNIATTRDQSARLLQCGVDPETADMSLIAYPNGQTQVFAGKVIINAGTIINDGEKVAENIDLVGTPAWSLGALLALLPSEIKIDESPYDEIQEYGLLIYPFMSGWQIDYQYCENDECQCLKCVYDTDLIEACVQAIEWLTTNNYKLNEL